MGRELRRKEEKKNGKGKQNKVIENSITKEKFIYIVFALVFLLSLSYLLSGIFITKEIRLFDNDEKLEEENDIVNNRILAIDALKQIEEVYYVYFYDTTNEDSEITSIVDGLREVVYRVDLHDSFNANFVGDVSISSDIENLRVSDPTVIKVSSEEIVSFYCGDDIKLLSSEDNV